MNADNNKKRKNTMMNEIEEYHFVRLLLYSSNKRQDDDFDIHSLLFSYQGCIYRSYIVHHNALVIHRKSILHN
jgi:hypothetical protein